MIFGIGIDTVSLDRIRAAYERFGSRFTDRVMCGGEIRVGPDHPTFISELATAFSIKEAVYKSLKPDHFPIRFKDVCLTHNKGGAPEVILSGRLADHAHEIGVDRVHVSVSHEKAIAVTVALALKRMV